jgi:hypothetical protein
MIAAFAAMGLAGAVLGSSGSADAAWCEGRVHGLSHHYNLATGSGYLAVRKRPTASSYMVGQLFNGDRVRITDRQGNWYRIRAGGGLRGWANARWIWNSCGW